MAKNMARKGMARLFEDRLRALDAPALGPLSPVYSEVSCSFVLDSRLVSLGYTDWATDLRARNAEEACLTRWK
jgi:hypothetical protein